ncbi:MAG: cytochrome c-type biogenesis protein [Thiohalorhabdus sp.]|uniref:cytochrome c-type biogenesis protein n=1 Tax=Thiohalorhabdus sp. TaxID=3094134 RepID=UPI00397FD8C3
MRFWTALLVLALALGPLGAPLAAPEPIRDFDNPAQEERYDALLEDLRCLVCQNESLADSRADLAQDLRDEVYQQVVEEGKNKEAVVDYLVDRYGEFVLYRPPMRPATYLLWFGPFALLLIGAGIWLAVSRGREQAEPDDLSPDEQERAARLLGTDSEKDSSQ